MKIFNENTPHSSIEDILCFSVIKQGYIQPESSKKKIMYFDWSVLFYPPYSLDLVLSNLHLFRSQQNPLNDKKIPQEEQMKTLVEYFSNSKQTEFHLRGINKMSDKWQVAIQNNGGYTIDWN